MGLPCTLLLTSSRFAGLPAIFQSFGSLSLTSFGTSSLAATAVMLPKLTVRWLGAWMTRLFSARHSCAGTFHSWAAAAMSISRPVAAGLAHVILGIAHRGLGLSLSSATTAMIIPLWQYPHCGTS